MASILVVEDHSDVRALIVEEVERMGHHLTIAGNGKEALQCLEKKRPELILCDINMPKMNGYEFRIQLSKQFPDIGDVPFIFVSAYADEGDTTDGHVANGVNYIAKPIDFDKLRQKISSLIGEGCEGNA